MSARQTVEFGSVCSGIEAASVAFDPLGWRAVWLAEIEPFPSTVLAHHYPAVPNLGDMTAIARRVLTGEVTAPDVLCGGTPCQAFSVAGLRKSLDDARGNLSLKFVELANAIDLVRARSGKPASVILWENVPGVLSTKDNAFGCFLAGLAGEDEPLQPPGKRWEDAGAVYGPARAIAWRVLDAQYFGLAQRRRRVFVVASARNGVDPAEVLFEWQGVRRDSAPSRGAGQSVAGTISARTEGGGGLGTDFDLSGGLQAFGGNNTSGAISISSALSALSAHGGSGRMDFESETFIARSLRGEGFDASEDGTGRGTPLVPVSVALRGREGGATAEVGDDCAFALRASGGGGDKPHVLAFDCKASGQAGFGSGEIASTQRAMGHKASYQNGGGHQAALTATGVRRLTPRECERLQGFPDDYTAVPVRGKPAADGPRYKALGNSWAVPCARWVGARIDNALRATA